MDDIESRKRRQRNFEVLVEKARDPVYEGELSLRLTHNGFQWNVLSVLPEEVEKICSALRAAIEK